MRDQSRKSVVVVSLIAVVLTGATAVRAGDDLGGKWIEGSLHLVLGTPDPVQDAPPVTTANLRLDDGGIIGFDLRRGELAEKGVPMAINGQRARVLVPDGQDGADGAITPLEIELVEQQTDSTDDVSGSQPWVSLMCKFSDRPGEPEDLNFFLNMYANSFPGLDHYWRALSYDMVNVVGSSAAGWFTLPHTQQHYLDLYSSSSYEMLGALYDDCTAAAGGSVNLNDFIGINLMFNDNIGSYAWGGSWGGRRVTWEPPWGWGNIAVMGHEMGHGFGLPHSNNADGDDSPYDNPWDVMSNSWGAALSHGTYGTVGKHTISYHKDMLGWIPPSRRVDVNSTGLYSFTIDHLTLAGTPNLHMVEVSIPGSSSFYTIEVRDRVGYDGNLPGFAVIIHEVIPGREEPAWLIDVDDDLGNGGDAGAMWLPGECFDDPANEISICVESVTTEGYVVEVGYGDYPAIFDGDFEDGSTGDWSMTES